MDNCEEMYDEVSNSDPKDHLSKLSQSRVYNSESYGGILGKYCCL
jgi:hypothetical protein